jgi:hypothetical protein
MTFSNVGWGTRPEGLVRQMASHSNLYRVRHKLDGRDAEAGWFTSEDDALRWWRLWSQGHPKDAESGYELVRGHTVIASTMAVARS